MDFLALDKLRTDRFRAAPRDSRLPRLFGGQVVAQALYAAGQTVTGLERAHSMHAYFLRPGDPANPIDFTVRGRQVEARQDDRLILTLEASFTAEATRPPAATVCAPRPEGIDQTDLHPGLRERWSAEWPDWELKLVPSLALDALRPGHNQVWIRFRERLPDVPLVHACALVYASDMTLISSTRKRHGLPPAGDGALLASLDHAVWFHGSFRADEWLLFDQQYDAGGAGRALTSARVCTADGAQVATVKQEGLLRVPA